MHLKRRRDPWSVPIHLAAKEIRECIGWNQARMATELGLSHAIQLRKLESGHEHWTVNMIELFREITQFDPYVLAYDLFYDEGKFPLEIQEAGKIRKQAWLTQLQRMGNTRHLLPSGWW